MRRRLLYFALGFALVLAGFALAQYQSRYRYERRLDPEGQPFYVEIYEEREQDLDSTANPRPVYTSVHREYVFFSKTQRVTELNAQRQSLVVKANDLQQRINAINALP